MAFRAFYALPAQGFQTATGQHTNAVYGFISMLVKLLETRQPTHLAVAFDVGRRSFRTEEYPEYKGTREQTPEEFKGQVELIRQALDAMGIVSLTKDGYEADDILATLATQGAQSNWNVYIVSGDRDTFQTVNDRVTVLYPGASPGDLKEMTPAAVEEKYGVPPHRYPEIAAIVGETSDNLPGVPGVGPKTAAQWINTFDGLDNLLARADEVGGKRGVALREHIDEIKRNRRLNHLLTDLDVGIKVSDLRRGTLDRQRLDDLFDTLEIGNLRKRVYAVSAQGGQSLVDSDATTQAQEFTPDDLSIIVCDGTGESDLLGAWCGTHANDDLAMWVQGSFLPARGRIDRLALASAAGILIVERPADLTATDLERLVTLLEGAPSVTTADWKGHWHAWKSLGIDLRADVFDVTLAAYLDRPEQRSYDAADLLRRYLNIDLAAQSSDDSDVLFDLDDVGGQQQAQMEAAHIVASLPALKARLDQELAQASAVTLLHDMEQPVASVLARMEDIGIAADLEEFNAQAQGLAHDAEKAQEAAFAVIGHTVNLASPKQLQEVLFDELGLPKTKKTKTGYTTNAEALQDLFAKTGNEFLQHLLTHRDRTKLRQMVDTLRASVGDDGRIHTTFSQVVAATGRLASSDPNLQNIPARTPDGLRIRDGFVAGRAYEALMSVDYSQIEMRIMAHLSDDAGLIDAFNTGEDLHRTMASMVFGVPLDQVSAEQRSRIKATSYGLAYGLSSYGLSAQLRIPVPEATQLREAYFQRFGGVRDYLASVVEQARRDGWTQTMFGRRRYLPDLNSQNRQRREMAERAALNAPIQGSAADIIKVAMIDVDRRIREAQMRSRLLLQIHDELLLEVAPGEARELEVLVREAMGSAVSMSVPLEVAVGVGASWRAAAH